MAKKLDNSWITEVKIKPSKMPKLLKEPKGENLSFSIKPPIQRKAKFPTVKFTKI